MVWSAKAGLSAFWVYSLHLDSCYISSAMNDLGPIVYEKDLVDYNGLLPC